MTYIKAKNYFSCYSCVWHSFLFTLEYFSEAQIHMKPYQPAYPAFAILTSHWTRGKFLLTNFFLSLQKMFPFCLPYNSILYSTKLSLLAYQYVIIFLIVKINNKTPLNSHLPPASDPYSSTNRKKNLPKICHCLLYATSHYLSQAHHD